MDILGILQSMVEALGYAGVFTATGLEYACFPISSEILLPFLGYTAARGQMSLFITILVSTLAGTCGSFFCYMIGRMGGNFLEQTLCRKFKTLSIGMDKAKKVFYRYGGRSVFLARMFPIARTYISFPAGMAAMDIPKFLMFTTLGAFFWNTILISCGYFLGSHWEQARTLFSNGWGIYLFLFLLCIVFLFIVHKKKNFVQIRKK